MEQDQSQNEFEKEKGQERVPSKDEQQSKRKKIFIASCFIILLLGGVGILIWRLTLPSHSYQVDRQNTYETKARTCIKNKLNSEDQALSEDCYEQAVSSRIVTNRVEQQQVIQSLIIDSTIFQYPNGSKLEIKGLEIDKQTLDNLRRRLQENTTDTVNETDPEFQSKLNSIPLFKIEVDPNDNTVKGIAIPVGVDRVIVSAAIQQLHHTNGGEEEKSSSLTGMRYINGRLFNPTIQRSSSIFGKREIQKEVSSKDVLNSEDDNLQPYWDANIKQTFRTNADGEVTESEIQAKQVISQETDQQKQVDVVTSTSQSSELKEQKQIDEDDAHVIQYIQERQQFDYYDQSNISLACLKREDQQEIIQLQQNRGEQDHMTNGTRILAAAQQAELINIKDQAIGGKNILGQQLQVAYDIYAYLLEDNTTSVQASLYVKLNGQIWQTLFSFQRDNLKTQDSKNFHKKLDIPILKFVFPIVGIPCVIDISSRFEFGYNFDYKLAYPQSLVYFNAYGAFIIDASGYINAVLIHVGAGVQSAIVRVNLPALLDADFQAKNARCQLSITAGSDLTLRLFARYPRISIIYRSICIRIFRRKRCINVPVGLVFWFDEKTIYAFTEKIAEKSWMLLDRQFTWR